MCCFFFCCKKRFMGSEDESTQQTNGGSIYQRVKTKKKSTQSPTDNDIDNCLNMKNSPITDTTSRNSFHQHTTTLFEYPNEITLNLMEEILLCGIKDVEGYTSLWNDTISIALRGAALIELALEGRIELDQSYSRRIPYSERVVVVKNSKNVGNHLLDEILSLMASATEPTSLSDWLSYLSGETWNPFKLIFQVRRFRDRLSKTLTEKRVLIPQQQDYVVFSVTTYPVCNIAVKSALINRIKDLLLFGWDDQLYLRNIRDYCLVVLAYAANVIDNVLFALPNEDYLRGTEIVSKIANTDLTATIRNLTSQLHKSDVKEQISALNTKKLEIILAIIQVLCHET